MLTGMRSGMTSPSRMLCGQPTMKDAVYKRLAVDPVGGAPREVIRVITKDGVPTAGGEINIPIRFQPPSS